MTSQALAALRAGLQEIDALQRANPTPQQGGGLTRPQVVRALGRSEVVLLSSHFERYLYALNEESVSVVLARAVTAGTLPEEMRLLHARSVVDALGQTSWDRRAGQLKDYSMTESDMWIDASRVNALDADRLLSWMKAPKCKSVKRFFAIWGIADIFTAVTRTKQNRQALWLRIEELVEKRNNIAHGDLTVEARHLDVSQYRSAVRKFCESADKQMAVALSKMLGPPRPW